MSIYYRAFQVEQVRRFVAWDDVDAEAIVYVRDDLRVTSDPLSGEAVAVEPAEEWKRFCDEELGFEVPAILRDEK